MKARLDKLEQSIQNDFAATTTHNQEELQQLTHQLEAAQAKFAQTTQSIAELKNALTLLRQEQREKTKVSLAQESPQAPSGQFLLQLKDAKILSESLVRQLNMETEALVDLNLIRFAEDKLLLPWLKYFRARKAFISIEDLIAKLKEVNVYSDKEHIKRLLLAVDALIADYPTLPHSAKKSLQQFAIKEYLIQPQILNAFPYLKEQYLINLAAVCVDSEPDTDIKVSDQEKERALSAILQKNAGSKKELITNPTENELQVAILDYLTRWQHNLKLYLDPSTRHMAQLFEQQKYLKRELEQLKNNKIIMASKFNQQNNNPDNSRLLKRKFFNEDKEEVPPTIGDSAIDAQIDMVESIVYISPD